MLSTTETEPEDLNVIALYHKAFVLDDPLKRSRVQADLHIGQPPATATDQMVMATRSPVVARGAIPEFDFADGTMPAEPVERVVDRGVRDSRVFSLNAQKNMRSVRMVVARSNHCQHGTAIPGEARLVHNLE